MVGNTEMPKYLKIDYDSNICDCIVHDNFIIETALKNFPDLVSSKNFLNYNFQNSQHGYWS